MKNICVSGKARDVTFALRFLKMWFDGKTIAEVSRQEYSKAINTVMREREIPTRKNGERH